MNIIVKINNVVSKYEEINEVLEKLKSIEGINEIAGKITSTTIERNFEEKKE